VSRRGALGWAALAVAAVVVVALVLQWRGAGAASPSATPPAVAASVSAGPTAVPVASATQRVAATPRVWVIVMENRSYGQVIGNGSAPFVNRLATDFGLATDYNGVAHPSEPNYLALVSGSTQGVTDDGVHDIGAPTLFDQLEQAGLSWAVYAENVPTGCYTGAKASGGADGRGTYARKHEPAISFTGISGNPGRCARITDLSHFDPAAADVSLVIPNLCHDMHDCSTAAGDAWLRGFVPRITGSPAFAGNALLVVVFDEADGGGNHIPLVFAGPAVVPGTRVTERTDHYSLLRTVQDLFGLPCLAQSCHAHPMPALLGAGGA
jgi:phosphatidylinositol-3-phosphatase